MQKLESLKQSKSGKFVMVGGSVTIIDFAMFNLLAYFGITVLLANLISTCIAMTVSFLANKRFTFNSKSSKYLHEVMLFLAFTTFGLWVIQSLAIQGILTISPSSWPEAVRLNVAKVIATLLSMAWNFLTYSRYVFFDEVKDNGEVNN